MAIVLRLVTEIAFSNTLLEAVQKVP